MKRLIIFTDPGLDDAAAILWLLGREENRKIDLVAVAGNMCAEQSLFHTIETVRMYEGNSDNVSIWSSMSVQQNWKYDAKIQGGFFSDRNFQNTWYRGDVLKDWDGEGEKADVLCLAPVTVLNRMLKAGNLRNIGRLVIMGGGTKAANRNGLEFNQSMDEEIFGQVLNRYKEAVELVTLDSCRLDVFDLLQTEIQYLLPDGALRQVLDQYQKNAMKRGAVRCIPYDLIAAMAYEKRELFMLRKEHVAGLDPYKRWRVPCWKSSTEGFRQCLRSGIGKNAGKEKIVC